MEFQPIILFSSILPILVSAFAFLSIVNKALSDDLKIQITEYLDSYSARDYAETTKTIFDQVYGIKIFSSRSFLFSSITSLITVFSTSFFVFGYTIIFDFWVHFFHLAVIIVTLNFVPDFLSLCQTRIIVEFMKKSNSVWFQLFMTIVDLILSLAIILLYLSVYFFLFHKHIPLIFTVEGFDVLQVVVLSTLIFSVLNLVFSLAVLLITITPKDIIFRYIERPIYLISGYVGAVFILLFVVFSVIILLAANLNIGQLLTEKIFGISNSALLTSPDIKEVSSALVAFLTFLILANFAFSQCAQSFRSYASTSIVFRIQTIFTIAIIVLLAVKLVSPTILTDLGSPPFLRNIVEKFLVPNGIPKWQLISLINGSIALLLTFYVINVTIDETRFRKVYITANEWFVTAIRLVSSVLSAYTVCVLVYNTASIQWDLLPICEEWTPWQNSVGTCTILEQNKVKDVA